MAWLDQLRAASFRNVPFHVDTIDVSAGDNVVLREYPFQDLPTVFRMGEAAEEIRFSAYVIGDDYIEQRDQLRDVLTGEGVLIHPTAGSIRVFVAGKYSIKENPAAEGGMARFDLTFVRADPRRYPVGTSSTEAAATDAAFDAALAAQEQYAADFSLDGVSGWVSDNVLGRISDSVSAVWASIGPVAGQLEGFASDAIGNYQVLRDGLQDFVRSPTRLAAAVADLFQLPEDMNAAAARDLRNAFGSLFNMGERVRRTDFEVSVVPAVGAGLVMYGAGKPEIVNQDTPVRRQLARLQATSDQLFETLATAAYVRATAAADLPGYVEACDMRATIHRQCVRLLVGASEQSPGSALPPSVGAVTSLSAAAQAVAARHDGGVPAWHDAVATLHAAALSDIRTRGLELGRLSTYTPEGWQPVWYVSYRLYGTADYVDEILSLNPEVEHPLLVPPGRALRVVARD